MKRIDFDNVITPREFVRGITMNGYLFGDVDTANAVGFINNVPVICKWDEQQLHICCQTLAESKAIEDNVEKYLADLQTQHMDVYVRHYRCCFSYHVSFYDTNER